MRLGIGLPTATPDRATADLAAIASRAEAAGFDTLGVVDRLAYRTLDPFVALAVAAAATERVTLTTSVLLAPLRAARIATKEIAALQQVAGGRFVAGLGVGNRRDDYEAAGATFERRGALLDELIASLLGGCEGEHEPLALDRLQLGGGAAAALRRVARLGCAWIYGGPDVSGFAHSSAELAEHWSAAGRVGTPRRSALSFVSLGDDAAASAERHIGSYYAYAPFKQQLIDQVATTPDAVRSKVAAYRDAGCDELLLFPCTASPVEIDRLADTVI